MLAAFSLCQLPHRLFVIGDGQRCSEAGHGVGGLVENRNEAVATRFAHELDADTGGRPAAICRQRAVLPDSR